MTKNKLKKIEKIGLDTGDKIYLYVNVLEEEVNVTPIVDKLNEIISQLNLLIKEREK